MSVSLSAPAERQGKSNNQNIARAQALLQEALELVDADGTLPAISARVQYVIDTLDAHAYAWHPAGE